MYTVCPECNSVFRVSAQQLQGAGGSVRCGKCDHTFNALLYLTEELPDGGAAIPASIKKHTPDPTPADNAPAADVVDDIADEFVDEPVEEEVAEITEQAVEANDEISEQEASSTATGFAARIRRFLEAAEKTPELKEDDTWSCDDEDEESSEVGEPKELAPLVPDASDAEVDPESDPSSGVTPVLTLVGGSIDKEDSTGAATTDETAPEEALEKDLESAEVVEDVDEFEAAVMATISESETNAGADTEPALEEEQSADMRAGGTDEEYQEESEQESEEETEEKLFVESDVIEETLVTTSDKTDKERMQADLAALAENVIDSMPDVVIEGPAQEPEDEEKIGKEDDLDSTADRIQTLDMLSDKEAETYFGEMLVDPDALAAEAQNDGESEPADDLIAEMADDESGADEDQAEVDEDDDEADEDESEVDEDDDEADEDESEVDEDDEDDEDIAAEMAVDDTRNDDEEDDESDDTDWRLADDADKGEESEDESPEPVLFIETDATNDQDDTKDNESESLEFDVPEDQIDSVFSEAPASSIALAEDVLETATDDEDETESPDIAQLATTGSHAVENIELSAEVKPRHDISDTYKPPPAPKYVDVDSNRRWWLVAGIVLATALTLQLVHFNRVSLSDSFMGGALKTVYGDLPRQSQAAWDISKYEIQRSAGVGSAANSGTLTIVGRLTNSADFAQPYPVLKLLLLDRWGDQIGVRNLRVPQYLAQPPSDRDNVDMMYPFEAASFEISIVDPDGEPAANFVIEICLPDGQGELACQ